MRLNVVSEPPWDLRADVLAVAVPSDRHLPEYVAFMTEATEAPGAHLHVAADVRGRHEEGEAMFVADEAFRRLEWGREGHEYHGWLAVTGLSSAPTSTVTIHLETHEETDTELVEQALDETLRNIDRVMTPVGVGH